MFKLPAGEAGVAAEAASACEKVASDWLRTAELDTEEEEKKEPEEVADAAIPPEPRTKTELSSEGAVRAICNNRRPLSDLSIDSFLRVMSLVQCQC